MRIMTVCLGNICRSPAAEAVLNRKLAEAGLDDVEVTSAGTSDEHVGARPHHLTREVGGELGYEFPTVGVQLSADLVDDADLILVMDNGEIVARGSHEELLESSPTYAEIVDSQLSAEEAA